MSAPENQHGRDHSRGRGANEGEEISARSGDVVGGNNFPIPANIYCVIQQQRTTTDPERGEQQLEQPRHVDNQDDYMLYPSINEQGRRVHRNRNRGDARERSGDIAPDESSVPASSHSSRTRGYVEFLVPYLRNCAMLIVALAVAAALGKAPIMSWILWN
jgi:hypothetical protein